MTAMTEAGRSDGFSFGFPFGDHVRHGLMFFLVGFGGTGFDVA